MRAMSSSEKAVAKRIATDLEQLKDFARGLRALRALGGDLYIETREGQRLRLELEEPTKTASHYVVEKNERLRGP